MVTLNKDGTERKKREPKAKKKDGGDPKGGKSKEQVNAQRNVMRETLRQLKEKRKDDPEAFEIGSVYDLALGLELWLNDNSKVFPEKPLKQKLDRMLQIQKVCIEQTNPDKVDVESLFWELASLYVIVNREAARPELNIQRPRFTMTAPKENYEEDPTLDKKENEARKRAMYLPAVGEDDEVSKEEVQKMLEEVEREVEKKINEMMDGGDGRTGEDANEKGTGATTSAETLEEKEEKELEPEQQQEQQQQPDAKKEEVARVEAKDTEEEAKDTEDGGEGDREMPDAPAPVSEVP